MPLSRQQTCTLGGLADPFRFDTHDPAAVGLAPPDVPRLLGLFGEGDEPPGGGGGGGDGGGESKLELTQKELDAMIEKRLSKERAKFSDYDQLKEQAQQLPTMKQQLEELQQQVEDANKSADEKAKAQAERERKAQEKKLEELEQARAQAEQKAQEVEQRLRSERISTKLTSAFNEAGAAPTALGDAVATFMGSAKIELEDDSGSMAIEYGDARYTDPKEAVTAYLEAKPHFAKAPRGGAGTPGPNGKPLDKPLHEMTTEELAAAAGGWPSD